MMKVKYAHFETIELRGKGGIFLNEIMLSAIVFACVAAFVGVVFLIKAIRDRRQKETLRQYCEKNRFQLRFWDKGSQRGFSIQSEGWILRACVYAPDHNAEAAGPGLAQETEWTGAKPDAGRPAFALFCSKAQCGFETLPEWVRSSAIAKMRRAFPGASDFSSVRTAFCEQGITCLAFENEEKSAQLLIERIRQAVGDWNGGGPVCIECTPERVRVLVRGCFMEEPGQIDALIRLGRLLTGY